MSVLRRSVYGLVIPVIFLAPVTSAWAFALYPLPVQSIRASSSAPDNDAANVNDDDESTAWRPAASDAVPWVEFDFGGSVQPGFIVIASESAAGIGVVRKITVTTDTGVSHELVFSEYSDVPAVRWPAVGAVRSLRITITECEAGGVGLAELSVAGRRAPDPDALTLSTLSACTLVLERDLVLPAQRPATRPVTVPLFTERDGYFPWSLQMRARDTSPSDRTVRAGKTFSVTAVVQTPGALSLQCDDGSTFGLFDESEGAPRSITSITGQFTIVELNDVFAGIARFEDARGRAVEDY